MLVIKKRISLDFLGDDYKDSFLIFKSIPLKDYEGIIEEISKKTDDNIQSLKFILKTLEDYFIEGTFQGEAVTKDDLSSLDQPSAIRIFETLTGQIDPKAETPSTTPSTSEAPSQ